MLYICDMISVYRVYNAVKDLANKEQKGFVTPQVFNSFAQVAQMNVYNEMFEELQEGKKARLSQVDAGGARGKEKQLLEDLSYFSDRKILSPIDGAPGLFNKPTFLSKIISIEAGTITEKPSSSYGGYGGVATECEIVYNTERASQILNSNLSAPTKSFPIALIDNYIEVFPTSLSQIKIHYYRTPGSYKATDGTASPLSPVFGYNLSTTDINMFSYNPQNSKDFMLPPHYLSEIVNEMALLIGIRLSDKNLQNFASAAEKAE